MNPEILKPESVGGGKKERLVPPGFLELVKNAETGDEMFGLVEQLKAVIESRDYISLSKKNQLMTVVKMAEGMFKNILRNEDLLGDESTNESEGLEPISGIKGMDTLTGKVGKSKDELREALLSMKRRKKKTPKMPGGVVSRARASAVKTVEDMKKVPDASVEVEIPIDDDDDEATRLAPFFTQTLSEFLEEQS